MLEPGESRQCPYTEQHKQETRKRIIQSARRLFNRHGFADVSIDDIMAGAGLTRGGFYKHFTGKEDLYEEAVLEFICAGAAGGVAGDAMSTPPLAASRSRA